MGSHRYCIIGAGAAGLATLDTLVRDGFDVDCFERNQSVGGHWQTDYESLHLITSRDISGFVGYPMPASYPVYPSRDQMREYLLAFATERGLLDTIQFGVSVTSVEPRGDRGDAGWTVTTSDGQINTYDAVIVANGHLWDPRLPDVPGEFDGPVIHSSAYQNVGDIEGRRVLVIGAGNSGCDLAVDVANARLDSFISVRRGQTFQPKAMFGKPRAELKWLGKLPVAVNERVSRFLVDVVVGKTSSYRGLPEPATRNLNKQPPVVNNLLLYWIHHGRITVVPGVTRFEGKTVQFTDGTSREFDTVLLATGFNVTFPFLDDSLFTWRDGAPIRTAGMVLPVGVENLYFIGLAAARGPQLPIYSLQSKMLVRMLRIRERGGPLLAAHFAAIEPAEARIDIIRKFWMRQMEAAGKTLDRLEQSLPASPPDTSAGASTDSAAPIAAGVPA
ncbi:MAG: flavin-containing monooxygenase fmo [Ilumatobacteraceae bacterium]|nr:flavin-containing monooxygenase fmo [Ilumatobacteraceae bacterium]